MCSDNYGITIIVPVYNCEKFIGKCIESVQAQTFTDWNLLLVDDGSPDNAGVICDEYAKQDRRISVIHQENGGPGKARNNGIELCETRWFTFLDSDDKLEPDYLENFHIESLTDNNQLSIQGFKRVDLKGRTLDEIVDFKTAKYKGQKEISQGFLNADLFMYGQSCGKLYNKPLIDKYGIRLSTEIKLSEDHLFYLQYMMHVSEIFTHKGTGYCYQMADAEKSLTHRIIPWDETLTRFHALYKATEDIVLSFGVKNNALLHKAYYFSVTGGISLVLSSLYKGENDVKTRRKILQVLRRDLQECGNKYCPNGTKGKVLKYVMLYAPFRMQDALLSRYMR